MVSNQWYGCLLGSPRRLPAQSIWHEWFGQCSWLRAFALPVAHAHAHSSDGNQRNTLTSAAHPFQTTSPVCQQTNVRTSWAVRVGLIYGRNIAQIKRDDPPSPPREGGLFSTLQHYQKNELCGLFWVGLQWIGWFVAYVRCLITMSTLPYKTNLGRRNGSREFRRFERDFNLQLSLVCASWCNKLAEVNTPRNFQRFKCNAIAAIQFSSTLHFMVIFLSETITKKYFIL